MSGKRMILDLIFLIAIVSGTVFSWSFITMHQIDGVSALVLNMIIPVCVGFLHGIARENFKKNNF